MARHSKDPSQALRDARSLGYTAARVGQGVPVLDRDLNLLGELPAEVIRDALDRCLGPGFVSGQDAFRVGTTDQRDQFEVHGPGWAVVGGWVVNIAVTKKVRVSDAAFTETDLLGMSSELTRVRTCWVWLDVWQEEVDEVQDPALTNPDDVGLVTSTRQRTTWGLRATATDTLTAPAEGHRYLRLAKATWMDAPIGRQAQDLRPVGLTLGGSGAEHAPGRLTLLDEARQAGIRLDPTAGGVQLWDDAQTLKLNAQGAVVGTEGFTVTGATGTTRVALHAAGDDRLVVRDGDTTRFRVDAGGGIHVVGDLASPGFFDVTQGSGDDAGLRYGVVPGHPILRVAPDGDVELQAIAAGAKPGTVRLRGKDGDTALELNADKRRLKVSGTSDGTYSEITDKSIVSANAEGKVTLEGDHLTVAQGDGKISLEVLQESGTGDFGPYRRRVMNVGGQGVWGRINVLDSSGKERLQLDDGVRVQWWKDGVVDRYVTITSSDLVVMRQKIQMIKLDGSSGNIKIAGRVETDHADCAERFPVAPGALAEPGTVLVTGDDEALRPCDQPYDTRVVGVVSGAGGLNPGIVLNDALVGGAAVALVGRVYCKVDASFGAIHVGDLLTTSATPGHAMKVTDRPRAFGAVLGKALAALPAGQGEIPILVTLQ